MNDVLSLTATVIRQGCQWLADTAIGTHIRESDNLFSIIETVHVLGIVITAGTIAIVDLRILGFVLNRYSIEEVLKPLVSVTWTGFFVMASSGLLLFWSEADKLYGNLGFRVKLVLLLLAGLNQRVFHTLHDGRDAARDTLPRARWRMRLAATVSLGLWAGIIVSGRAIAYL